MSAPSLVEGVEAEKTQDQVTKEDTALFGADNQEAPLSEEVCQEDHQEAMEDPQEAEDPQMEEGFQPRGIQEQISHDLLIVL